MLTSLSPEERMDLLLSIGTHKKARKRSPLVVAELIDKALRSESLDDVAKDLELADTSVLRRFLALLTLPPEIGVMVTWGGDKGYLSFSTASEISRLQIAEQSIVAKLALERRLSRNEIRDIIQRRNRGNVSVEAAAKEILDMRPAIERQYLYVGIINRDLVRDFEEGDLRGRLRKQIAQLVGASNILSANVRNGRFSFMLTEAAALQPDIKARLQSESLDEFINKLIMAGIQQ